MGRVRVRIHGYHSDKLSDVPVKKLPWAHVTLPTTSAAVSGFGQSPTALLQGSKVFGFFMDGHDAQMPIVVGSLPAEPAQPESEGFRDPDGKYPSYEEGEQDCNRVATNRKIDETNVKKRRDDRDKKVKKAFDGEWDEKETEKRALQVVGEGKERIMLWHKKGNFTEIHDDGTEVHKIKKDNYEIIYGDNYVHILGKKCTVTIDDESRVLIKGDAFIEIKGDCNERIHGDYTLEVYGNMKTTVDGTIKEESKTSSFYKAPRIDINE